MLRNNSFNFVNKRGLFLDKYLGFLGLLSFLNPLIAITLFYKGLVYNYQSFNVYINFFLVIPPILIVVTKKKKLLHWHFIGLIILTFTIAFINYLFPTFEQKSFVEMLGLYVGLFTPPILSFYLVNHLLRFGNLKQYFLLIFRAGILIAIFNICLFILLYNGDYSGIFAYTEFLGLGSYIKDLGSYFIRPAGYFFDYHSQFFIPLISLVLALGDKIELQPTKKVITVVLIIVSIFLSGIKTAYLILIAVLIIYLLMRFRSWKFILIPPLTIFFLFIVDSFFDFFLLEILRKIAVHDINILIEHFFEVPKILISEYPMVFLFGGQVGMEAFLYSEVYYITMIYYIGFFGMFLIFIFPNLFLLFKGQGYFEKAITIIFALSLSHYYVYKVSFNVFGSAIVYSTFLIRFYQIKMK